MTDLESLLNSTRYEIMQLRRDNEILRAKVETMDLFALILKPRYGSQGASPDIAWALQKKIDELAAAEKKEPQTIAELEALLKEPDDPAIRINPDGTISRV